MENIAPHAGDWISLKSIGFCSKSATFHQIGPKVTLRRRREATIAADRCARWPFCSDTQLEWPPKVVRTQCGRCGGTHARFRKHVVKCSKKNGIFFWKSSQKKFALRAKKHTPKTFIIRPSAIYSDVAVPVCSTQIFWYAIETGYRGSPPQAEIF